MMGWISIFRLPIVLREKGCGRERGLSNRFPVSTAQSLRHHSIVCFTTQFFRHCLAVRIPPQCRRECADDTPEKEIILPGFKISVDIVWVSSPQHLSVLSSRLLRIFLSHRPDPLLRLASIAESPCLSRMTKPPSHSVYSSPPSSKSHQ